MLTNSVLRKKKKKEEILIQSQRKWGEKRRHYKGTLNKLIVLTPEDESKTT